MHHPASFSGAAGAWHGTGNRTVENATEMKNERKNDEQGRERDPSRDIRKEYDPYKRDPGAGKENDERVSEADEREAREREAVRMEPKQRLDDSATSPVIDTGHAGQMAKGSYGFNSSTGQGEYMDRTRDGVSDAGVDPLAVNDPVKPTDLGDTDDDIEAEELHP